MAEKKKERTSDGCYAPGCDKPAGSGKKLGHKLRKLDLIIAETEVKLGRQCDPVVTLIELGAGYDAVGEAEAKKLIRERKLDPKTKSGALALHAMTTVDRATRVDACKAASKFVRPQLQNSELSGPGGGPIETKTFPVLDLIGNDKAVALIEQLHIALAEKEQESRAAAPQPASADEEEQLEDGGQTDQR